MPAAWKQMLVSLSQSKPPRKILFKSKLLLPKVHIIAVIVIIIFYFIDYLSWQAAMMTYALFLNTAGYFFIYQINRTECEQIDFIFFFQILLTTNISVHFFFEKIVQ